MNDRLTVQDQTERSTKNKWLGVGHPAWAILALVLVLLADWFMRSDAAYRRHYTCMICRLERTEVERKNGPTDVTFHENSCSVWYPTNIEPSHEHIWSKGSSIAILNHYGQVTGVGDNFDQPGRAIRKLTPEEQIEVYRHFSVPLAAKRLFLSLMDPHVMKQKNNEGDYWLVLSLKEWVDSGCSSSWINPLEKKP